MMEPQHQKDLPFAEAEGTRAERRALLGRAIVKAEADCQLSVFLQWVFNVTAGGRSDVLGLCKTQLELAYRPWGLCCSRSKAKSTVGRARELGLITAEEARYVSGGQRATTYVIDWPGIWSMLGIAEQPLAVVATEPTPVATEPTPVLWRPGSVLREPPYKETTFFVPSLNSLSLPVPVPGPMPSNLDLITELPILRARRGRPVLPLPIGNAFPAGIFAGLEIQYLRRVESMIRWFRLQLATPQPVAGPNEAELLLVLAAARHALAVPADQVKKSRPAIFASIVGHGRERWGRVKTELPAAAAELDRLLADYGRPLLEGQQWPPAKLETVTH